jgi:hypothetical protein
MRSSSNILRNRLSSSSASCFFDERKLLMYFFREGEKKNRKSKTVFIILNAILMAISLYRNYSMLGMLQRAILTRSLTLRICTSAICLVRSLFTCATLILLLRSFISSDSERTFSISLRRASSSTFLL